MSGRDERSREEAVDLQLTPMIDISFLILVFFMCLPFKTLEGKLQAFLPTDSGIDSIVVPEQPVTIDIEIAARNPAEGAPTRVVYRHKQRRTTDIDEVGRWIRRIRARHSVEARPQRLEGELRAQATVPHKHVVAVLNRFAEERVKKVRFFGTAIPDHRERNLPFLARPQQEANHGE